MKTDDQSYQTNSLSAPHRRIRSYTSKSVWQLLSYPFFFIQTLLLHSMLSTPNCYLIQFHIKCISLSNYFHASLAVLLATKLYLYRVHPIQLDRSHTCCSTSHAQLFQSFNYVKHYYQLYHDRVYVPSQGFSPNCHTSELHAEQERLPCINWTKSIYFLSSSFSFFKKKKEK